MKRICFLGIALLCSVIELWANNPIEGKVITVLDGNTIEVKSEKETYKIFLAFIDSPELGQEYGLEAKRFLEQLVLNKEVTVQFCGKDRKGNLLGVVLVDDDVDLRVELLKEGLAWTSEKNPVADLEAYRTWAERKGKGLWKQKGPTPPWVYRRQQTLLHPKTS